MAQRGTLFAVLSAACLIFCTAAMGQGRPGAPPTRPQQPTQFPGQSPADVFGSRGASITVRVGDQNGLMLNEQALVKLSSTMTGMDVWHTTQDRSEAVFDSVPLADYDIEVSAAGYETTTQHISVMSPNENYDVFVRLRPSDVGNAVAVPGQVLVGRAQSEAQKGIADMNAGKWKDARKHLEKAYKIAPTNADVNYLMAILCSRTNRATDAEQYLKKAISLNPKHVRALTMQGQLLLRQKDYKGAIVNLEQAVSADPKFWTAHWLLADAHLKSGDFEKSREQAEAAIRTGKGAATGAELVLGEALANLGRNADAVRAFREYLQAEPKSPYAPSVRKFIAELDGASSSPRATVASYRPASTAALKPVANVLPSAILAESADPGTSIPTWHPPSVDDEKLTLAAGAVCPAGRVIAGAGRSAKRLVDNISRFEATEQVTDQQLDVLGKPESTQTRKFDYMASITSESPGALLVDESRAPLSDQGDFPDHITARGLAALALIFHPALRGDYAITCEGLGSWKGRATWLVYFRQRPDRPNRFLRYEFTNASYAVALKGRAWIAADNFQIVHLETDILHPMRQIQLLSQHQSVDYGPVQFRKRRTELWLPKTANIYFEFHRRRYHRRDTFDDFKLFAVSTSEKIGQPNIPATTDQTDPPRR